MAAQLQFRDVTLGYDRHPAVHHLDGEVASGALLAIVGPNGAGKSTLFRGIAGILKPLAGSIVTGGLDLRDIAYLPQTVDIDRSFPISVYDFVGTGLWRVTGFFGGMGKTAREKIAQALAAVGLNGFENRPIGTLSGGQMQRLLFARVLLQDARLIVLDEPFNAIDAKTSVDLLALVRRWHAEKRTVLAALHDMDLVRANFPEALLLHHLDNLDSKMECMRSLVEQDRQVTGYFTGYNASLERTVLKKAKYMSTAAANGGHPVVRAPLAAGVIEADAAEFAEPEVPKVTSPTVPKVVPNDAGHPLFAAPPAQGS